MYIHVTLLLTTWCFVTGWDTETFYNIAVASCECGTTFVPSLIETENVCSSYCNSTDYIHVIDTLLCNYTQQPFSSLVYMVPPFPTMPYYCMYVPMYVRMYVRTTVVVFYTGPDITICSAASAHLLSYTQAGRLESPRLGLQP